MKLPAVRVEGREVARRGLYARFRQGQTISHEPSPEVEGDADGAVALREEKRVRRAEKARRREEKEARRARRALEAGSAVSLAAEVEETRSDIAVEGIGSTGAAGETTAEVRRKKKRRRDE